MWLEIGYDHESFWDQTAHSFSLTIKAFKSRQDRQHNERAWAVWHIAALMRSKELPKIERLMIRSRQRAAQTWQDIKAAFKAINAASGGVFRKKGEHGR